MNKELTLDAEYASEVMDEIPAGYINKTICGCGLTTVALENQIDTVIAVPTIYLAHNKAIQYPNSRYDGKILAVTGETTPYQIKEYLITNRILKIIVTYDSLQKVEHLLNRCQLIIDESNELLSKTKLKPEIIHRVFDIAKKHKDTVSFISATPTPLEYMPDWISKIDQITIKWTKTKKMIPITCKRTFPLKSLKYEIILQLKENGSVTVSDKTFKKVIVFINSIDKIVKLIKESELDMNECGIICGDSVKNDIKIKGINRYLTGDLPKYLFITSSGFSGIDLYDKEAMTIVVSNTTCNYHMIDLLTDLKQAASRQRDKDNPNYGYYVYIYNQSIFDKPEEQLIQEVDEIYKRIVSAVKLYELGKNNKLENGFYKSSEFIQYTLLTDDGYIINEQAFLADKYFILEIRKQYKQGFDINAQFEDSEVVEAIELPREVNYKDLVEFFNANKNSEGTVDWGPYSLHQQWISIIETSFRLYKKVWKDQTYAKMMIENYGDGFAQTKQLAGRKFVINERYKWKEAKEKLQDIYKKLDINRKAKHTDLNEIFTSVQQTRSKGEIYIKIIVK